MAERLRLGILCDGLVFKHWEAECLRQVLAVNGVEPVVLITNDKPPGVSGRGSPKHALYRWFKRKRLRARALSPVDLSSELKGIPRLSCRPQGSAMAQRFDNEDLAAIKGYAPDVLLCFGFGVLSGD